MSYMVSVHGGSAPSVTHDTLEAAKAEAERLAGQSRNRYATIFVLQIVGALEPRTSHEWKGCSA